MNVLFIKKDICSDDKHIIMHIIEAALALKSFLASAKGIIIFPCSITFGVKKYTFYVRIRRDHKKKQKVPRIYEGPS